MSQQQQEQTASIEDLAAENRELHERLEAAEEMLRALRGDEVDALVVGRSGGERVYSLGGADECYRSFVEVMCQGAATVAPDGTILYHNRHFAQLVRSPDAQLLGGSIYDFVAPEDEGLLRALIWEGLSSPLVKRQLPLRAPDGKPISCALTATLISAGGANNVCLLVNDLTEYEGRIAAEAASAAKDRLLALVSHELRTPLTPVLITASVLEADATLPANVRDDVAMIRRNIELETRLIDDLLDLSRVISGKLRLQRQRVSVQPLATHVLQMLRSDAHQKRVQIDCNFDPTMADARVNADPARMHQVLWNLIRNAIKFSQEGGRILVRCSIPDPETVTIEVCDDGVGIDAATLPRIFNPFEQGQDSVTQRSGGLGLGLAIAKAVVEAHGGTIAAHSDGVGCGARFTVTLPLATAARSGETSEDAQAHSSVAHPPLRLLVVEDHRDTAAAIRRLLENVGHVVKTASCVDEALDLASRDTFDLVISDIGLPDGTGHDLIKRLRQRHSILGIALTGYGAEVDVQSSSDAGFAEHVTKPVHGQDLIAAVDRVARIVGDRRA